MRNFDLVEQKLLNLSFKWKRFFELLASHKVEAGFGDQRARQLLDEFWDVLQLVFEDIIHEMEKQGFDSAIAQKVPQSVWDVIEPKMAQVVKMHQKDLESYCNQYKDQISQLNKDIAEEILLFKDISIKEILDIFNSFLKE